MLRIQGQRLCDCRQLTVTMHTINAYAIPFDSLKRHLKVLQRLIVCNLRIRQHECTQSNISANLSILSKDNLVEMGGHGDIRRIANDLVANSPLAIRLFLGQIQRPSDYPHRRIASSETTAEVLEVCPVVSVEALSNLRTHVAQRKRIIHSLLRPLCVRSRDLVSSVIATAEVILELRAELFWYGIVFDKDRVFAVSIAVFERLGGDVLDNPRRISGSAVVCRGQGCGGSEVRYRARESVLIEAIGIDGSGDSGESFLDTGGLANS